MFESSTRDRHRPFETSVPKGDKNEPNQFTDGFHIGTVQKVLTDILCKWSELFLRTQRHDQHIYWSTYRWQRHDLEIIEVSSYCRSLVRSQVRKQLTPLSTSYSRDQKPCSSKMYKILPKPNDGSMTLGVNSWT